MTGTALPLHIDDQMQDAIATAFDSGNFTTVAYIASDGWPHISRRGSTQVFGPQQLAIWIRKRSDGIAAAENRKVTVFYTDLAERGVVYTFYGHARLIDDATISDQVWAATPEREKAQDPQRQGIPLIIDLDRIVAQGRRPELNFVMERGVS